ncbi:MAG: hypothetical protein K2W96_10590 [Gemmataceae bacterium]|nr:hypothetical protein [Gemmataceae bacterium]
MKRGATPEEVLAILAKPVDGVLGIVDGVLALAADSPLRLEFVEGGCKAAAGGREATMPFRRSVFRAMLARIAVLSDEQAPGSFSPYGGIGTVLAGPARVRLKAVFSNTTQTQALDLQPVAEPLNGKALVQGAVAACPT